MDDLVNVVKQHDTSMYVQVLSSNWEMKTGKDLDASLLKVSTLLLTTESQALSRSSQP
jgi:hypothetical protein